MSRIARNDFVIPRTKRSRCNECCGGGSKRWEHVGNVSQILRAVQCSCAAEATRAQQIVERRERKRRLSARGSDE